MLCFYHCVSITRNCKKDQLEAACLNEYRNYIQVTTKRKQSSLVYTETIGSLFVKISNYITERMWSMVLYCS